ncbi:MULTISPECIES: Gfo/Idh/MocA family protein [Mesorhizobium]|uniref:Gfo/Idh/MocA family oxidoreductase n=1 Tax=Mesorhizobium denitrificans TaxID=2294114 RepID=A0A371XIR1_9HYPH|nr:MULTISPECIES: Gfo/Idh/MocA family oxidoreductase [Mesorhizobium]RFC68934.1 gfo/Idh/MocA family oxidoreductase [Mesorhizobium denitrificans]
MARRLRLGMVGGGIGGFFGAAHRIAARIDDRFELVAAALSSSPERAKESAAQVNIASYRSYVDFEEMAQQEAARSDGIEAVGIVLPNHLHYSAARAFVEAGIHVMCEKPLATSLADAEALATLVAKQSVVFAVAYTNAGFAMVREARRLVKAGAIGKVRVVQVEFPQEWLASDVESTGNKQATWRTDPLRSGRAGSLGDIGTHAFHLAEYVSGQHVESVAAQLSTFVNGRRVDDDVQMLLQFEDGAKGMLWASQVAIGHSNGLALRVYGDEGSLSWSVVEPNLLKLARPGEVRIIERGSASTATPVRLPPGHPEGFLEALAQLYADFADAISAYKKGTPQSASFLPGIADGVRGMRFIEAALKSTAANASMQKLD